MYSLIWGCVGENDVNELKIRFVSENITSSLKWAGNKSAMSMAVKLEFLKSSAKSMIWCPV